MADARQNYIITAEQMQDMLNLIVKRPADILSIEACRQHLALDRWKKSGQQLRIHHQLDSGVMPDTIPHNRGEVENSIFRSSRRTARLLNPLSAIEPVYSNAPNLRALSIGPRTEMELLHLFAIGFQPENVRGLDLISSSHLIDAGDMHDLPYADQSFDVVISGWTIAYSNRPDRVMHEMLRVCKDGGLIAVGVSYNPPHIPGTPVPPGAPPPSYDSSGIDGNNFAHASDLAALMGTKIDTIILQHEPPNEQTWGAVMLIARIKH